MKTSIKIAFILVALLFSTREMRAGGIHMHKRIEAGLNGCPTVPANSLCATDTLTITPMTGAFRDYSVEDIVTLGIDHSTLVYYPDSMTCQVNFTIIGTDRNGNSIGIIKDSLSVIYQPFTYTTYRDKAAILFSKIAYNYIIQITAIKETLNGVAVSSPTLPGNVYLDADIKLQRYYDYTTEGLTPPVVNGPVASEIDCGSRADDLMLSWQTQAGAENYDVEWTFVNDYNTTTGTYIPANQLSYNFRYNSTRVTVPESPYDLTLAYEHGYIVYRVRGVGVDMYNPSIYVTGAWSLADSGNVGSVSTTVYPVTVPHEGDSLDWQYNATFAEEGKKKEVVTYYDGSMRSREAVTKMNSDSNVLVGQTIYDYQGRPAVTALPVPVKFPSCTNAQPSIHYYPLFNTHDTTAGVTQPVYSRLYFDLDTQDSCTVSADSMSRLAGASNYYSPENPRQYGFYAYIPDAHGYPFSQVQYTPDNTGRIRSQGGVGPQFQIGSNHETKYIYGQPNQLELDRMFGSEVGNATHYKKNIVIDPNGQASASYMDQEGRTIATCLAGAPGTDSTGNFNLSPIPSYSGAQTNLRVDMFADDANGHSSNNVVNIDGTAIEYNTQLTVGYTSPYHFKYFLKVDTLGVPCSKICFNCVYDFQLRITNDCGQVVAATHGENPLDTVLGYSTEVDADTATKGLFHIVGKDTVEFIAGCSGNPVYNDTDGVTIILTPGNYTVSKILTVDTSALHYYVSEYLDSANRVGCVKTLSNFTQQALAATDTCSCYITCQSCEKSLGDRDAFVAAGKGTAEQYDFLYQQCGLFCKQNTLCDAEYDQMLADVSPDGQYGQFLTSAGNIDPGSFPVSVFNTNNRLPQNIATGTGDWHFPKVLLNGNTYPYYIDGNGNRSTIGLSQDPVTGAFIPAIVNSTDTNILKHNSVTGQYYTFPENLQNFTDFRGYWQTTWAQSLVMYHPEYPNYLVCQQYEQVQSPDTISSVSFDQKMQGCSTFQQAVAAGFINSNYLSISSPNERVTDFFAKVDDSVYDPFLIDPIYESDYGTPGGNKLNTEFKNLFFNYSSGNSMVMAAAAMARCGMYASPPSGGACTNFGENFYSYTTPLNDTIRNQEWRNFKNLYLAAKQKEQQKIENYYTLYITPGYNICIGNASYSTVGMWSGSAPLPIFNPEQPCSCGTYNYYANKQKRFVGPGDIPNQSTNAIGYQLYMLTGQCPAAQELQGFLNSLATTNKLKAAHDTLTFNGAFPAVYNAINGVYPPNNEVFQWSYNDTIGDTLYANIETTTGASQCAMKLWRTGSTLVSWNGILSLQNLQYTSTNANGTDNFTVQAEIYLPADTLHPYQFKTITGTSCVPIHGCQFATQCQPNQFAIDLSRLMSALAANGQLTSPSVNLQNSPYLSLLTPTILNAFGWTNTNATWGFSGGVEFTFSNSTSLRFLEIAINGYIPTSFTSSALNSITEFDSINYTGNDNFTIKGLDNSGNTLVVISAEAIAVRGLASGQLSMGTCGNPPQPYTCQGQAYSNVNELSDLLGGGFSNESGDASVDIDITKSSGYIPAISGYLPSVLDSTSSSIADSINTGEVFQDTLKFSMWVSDSAGGTSYKDTLACPFYLTYKDTSKIARFKYLKAISGLTPYGPQSDGYYYHFYCLATFKYTIIISEDGGRLGRVEGYSRTDTIWGESCIPMLNCTACTAPQQTPVTYGAPALDDPETPDTIVNTIPRSAIHGSAGGYPTQDFSFGRDTDQTVISFVATAPYMLIKTTKPVNQGDAPMAVMEYIHLDTLSGDSLDIRDESMTVSAGSDTLPVIQSLKLDTGKTYYVYMKRYLSGCSTCLDSTSYIGLSITNINFVDPPAPSCNITALGPNLIYDGDFETVPAYTLNAPCYEVNSPLYPNSLPTYITSSYPTYSNMRYDNCNLGVASDYSDCYVIEGDIGKQFQHNPHSGTHYLGCDAPSASCKECSTTDSTVLLYTPDYIATSWQQYVTVVPGNTYQFTVWVEDLDASPYQSLPGAILNVYINDTSYFHDIISTSNGYGTWKKITFCWEADTNQANIQITGEGESSPMGYDYAVDDITFAAALPTPCTTLASLDTIVKPPYNPTGGNPCVSQLLGTAAVNAQNEYNEYRDSLATAIRTIYMKHCLNPVESLMASYTDEQYHYTLYYYDQAGNLVRTVPPQGVQLLPITSSSSPDEVSIIHDRTYNQRTIFTDHVLSSTYVYNSLNQLIEQSVPDDDNMQIWNFTLPSGLNSQLNITGTQFIDASNGFLSGYILGPQGQRRGYLYKTHDAGHTWQQMNGTIGVNLSTGVMNGSNGYTVGDNGIVMQTLDKGNNWDIVPLYQYGITQKLAGTDVDTKDNVLAVVGNGTAFGMDVSGNFPVYYAPPSGGSISSTDSLTSVKWDANNDLFYAVGDSSGYGVMYVGTPGSTNAAAITWAKAANNITAMPVYKVQFIKSLPGHGYAAGVQGTLMHTTDKGAHWYMVPTATLHDIRDLYFINDNVGIALIDSSQQHGRLYATGNGGHTWSVITKPGEYYYAMSLYLDSAGTGKGYKGVAVGYKGLITRIVSTVSLKTPFFGEIPLNSPTTINLRAVYAKDNATGVVSILVGGEGHQVYYTTNASGSTATWKTLAVGTTIAKAGFIFDGSNNYMIPAMLSDRGTLIRLSNNEATSPSNTLVFADSTSGANYTSITSAGITSGNDSLFTINENASAATSLLLLSQAPGSGVGKELTQVNLTTSGTAPSGTALNALGYTGRGNLLLSDSNSQSLYNGVISGTSITWANVSTNIHTNRISCIYDDATSSTFVYSAGDRGRMYNTTITSPGNIAMHAVSTTTLKNIYGLVSNSNTIYAVGDSSLIFKEVYSGTGYALSSVMTIGSPLVNTPLYGIAISGTAGYIAGAKGTELVIPNSTSASANLGLSGGVNNFNGIFKNALGGAFLVGNGSNLWTYGNTSGKQVDSLFDCRFWAVNFEDINHGYVVGDSGIIRRTDNGGVVWQTVLPEINSGGGIPDIYTVWTTSPGNAIIGGSNDFFGQSYPDNITMSAGSYSYAAGSSAAWYRVRFNANFLNTGYMVGSGGNILSLDVSGGQMQTFSPISSPTANDLHCIHVFRDNSFIVAGASGTIYYDNLALSGWINCSPSTNAHYTNFTFNDIYFRDDINGYVVGDSATNLGGVIMKCQVLGGAGQIQSLSPTTYSGASNPLGFVEEPVEDGSTAKNIVSNTNQVNYNTIAFTGPYDGFVGGSYSTTPPSNTQNYPYARLLNDRGGEFSRLIWYDRVGRLTVGQDSKQHNYARQAYSYTLYDQVGHVLEVGQKTDNIDTANGFNKIFGDTLFGLYNTSIISPTKFLAWIKDSTGPRTEVSHTYYSNQSILPLNVLTQSNLRNRIVSITYSDTLSSDSLKYSSATHYDYDIQGDVKEIIKDNPRIGIANQRYKSISYKYSMIGKTVDEVDYQNDSLDQYHHKFSYDQDNRLVCVQTSKDSILWDNDANYFYYPHGELARMEIGDQKIQGVDYAYTLQGWIKGKNSDLTTAVNDIGHDGLQQSGNLNRCFARDAMGFSLKYFDKSSQFPGDYDAISSAAWSNVANRFEAYTYGSDLTNGRRDLFNGNVSAVVTTITKPQVYSKSTPSLNPVILPQGAAYSYDQLNRLITMKAYQNINASTNTWGTGSTYVGLYYDSLRYDENGNILYQQRNDSVGGVMSMLNYHYNNGTGPTLQNRLYNINNVAVAPNNQDLKDEGVFNSTETTINQKNNYRYNGMGELAKDSINGIDTIIWTHTGKPKFIIRYPGNRMNDIVFDYDESNYRIAKHVYSSSGNWLYDEYYLNDATGKLLAIYRKQNMGSNQTFKLIEREVYGIEKLAVENSKLELISPIPMMVDTFNRYLGAKRYALSNYLDNVLTVISDRVIPRPNASMDSINHFEADVLVANDYYPFGMLEPGRNFNAKRYRFAFNGKLKDDDMYGPSDEYDYGKRFYDPRIGRFMSEDMRSIQFPYYSPYLFTGNSPIMAIDLDGLEPKTVIDDKGYLTHSAMILVSLMSNVSTSRIDYVNVVNHGSSDWIITQDNTIHFPENYFTGDLGKTDYISIYFWFYELSHEVRHLPQEDQYGGAVGFDPVIGVQYTESWFKNVFTKFDFSIIDAHNGADFEIDADKGMHVFEAFAKTTYGAQIIALFSNQELTDEERVSEICDIYEDYLKEKMKSPQDYITNPNNDIYSMWYQIQLQELINLQEKFCEVERLKKAYGTFIHSTVGNNSIPKDNKPSHKSSGGAGSSNKKSSSGGGSGGSGGGKSSSGGSGSDTGKTAGGDHEDDPDNGAGASVA